MRKEDFAGLLESVQQAGEIMRGVRQPSREFVYPVAADKVATVKGFAVCLETDDV